jgi:hypothetical protein
MRTKKIHIPIYEFDVILYQLEDANDVGPIAKALKRLNITEMIQEVTDNLTDEVIEGGFTCFNGPAKLAVVVLYPTEYGEMYESTLDHEKRHVVDHVLDWVGVHDYEAAAYLSGWLTTKFKV